MRVKMKSNIIELLKDPYLVATIQRFFGVKIHYSDLKRDKQKTKCSQSNNDLSKNEREKTNGHYKLMDGEIIHENIQCCIDNKETHKHISNHQGKCQMQTNFTVTNHFWYYLFLFGTELGDEIFYSTFIPFWFWNIDGPVGRRVLLVWAIVMTIGQILKDLLHWPRPACPPAVRLQSKWSQEYGMPSTHAMVGISIPFSVVLFTMNRYIYSFPVGCFIATLWCALVSTSRIYLGMHTVLDIVVGLLLAIILMIPLVPLVDITDNYIISNFGALAILLAMSIATIVYYPKSSKWTPTRGDTTMVVSVTAGIHVGAWLNYYTGVLSIPSTEPPYPIIWPSYLVLSRVVLRTVLGFSSVLATKVICKQICYTVMCAILRINVKDLVKSEYDLKNRNKIVIDLVNKYITCFMIGFNTVYLLPIVFTLIGIERSSFYSET